MRYSLLLPSVLAVCLSLHPGLRADPAPAKGDLPLHISHGAPVKVTDYLVPGKTTVIDFYSEYCPPCRALAPLLEKLHQTHADVAVVEVDINRPGVKGIDWESPVAAEYKLQSIPHLSVYSPEGKLVADGPEATDLVVGWIEH